MGIFLLGGPVCAEPGWALCSRNSSFMRGGLVCGVEQHSWLVRLWEMRVNLVCFFNDIHANDVFGTCEKWLEYFLCRRYVFDSCYF